jgi:hypothetical protein
VGQRRKQASVKEYCQGIHHSYIQSTNTHIRTIGMYTSDFKVPLAKGVLGELHSALRDTAIFASCAEQGAKQHCELRHYAGEIAWP